MAEQDKYEWYCVLNGSRIGPMNWEGLRDRVGRGQLHSSDLVWAAPFGDAWRPAGSVEGLFPEIAAIPLPPPPPPVEEPPAGTAPEPSVVPDADDDGPLSSRRAFRRIWRSMVQALFRPFDIARWFSFGFCAWLANIGGGGPNLQSLIDVEELKASLASGTHSPEQAIDKVFKAFAATPIFTAAILGAIILGVLFAVLFCWLRARGSFMFLHRLEHPKSTVREAWQVAGVTAMPLFWWRLGLGALGWIAILAIVAGAAVSIGLGLVRSGDWAGIGAAISLQWLAVWGGGLVMVLSTWSTLKSMSFHFVEPIMYRHQTGVWDAWQRVGCICRNHPFAILRFFILLSLFWVAAVVAIVLFICCSCCLGLLLLVLPLVGCVALLPILWVHRGIGVEFLKQIP